MIADLYNLEPNLVWKILSLLCYKDIQNLSLYTWATDITKEYTDSVLRAARHRLQVPFIVTDPQLLEQLYFLNGYLSCDLGGIETSVGGWKKNNCSITRGDSSTLRKDTITMIKKLGTHPAFVYEVWIMNDQHSRVDGPTVQCWSSGETPVCETWMLNNQCHRTGGPAVTHRHNGAVLRDLWFLHGFRQLKSHLVPMKRKWSGIH
jgi:hypothetical protein